MKGERLGRKEKVEAVMMTGARDLISYCVPPYMGVEGTLPKFVSKFKMCESYRCSTASLLHFL